MAFLGSFGDFGQSQMLTRVRQSIAIQNNKIANLKSKIIEANRLKGLEIRKLAADYWSVIQSIRAAESGGGWG